MMHRTFAVLLTVASTACGGGGNPVEPLDNSGVTVITGIHYQTDRDTYAPSDVIVSQLLNATDEDVGYNLCTSTLERRTASGGWAAVRRNSDHVCILPLYILRPGESTTYREPASVVPGPGTYRLRASVEAPLNNGTRRVATQPFTVR